MIKRKKDFLAGFLKDKVSSNILKNTQFHINSKIESMPKILFICSANQDRSPTAERIYAEKGFEVKSAGTNHYARVPVSAELLQWAEVILCMGRHHKLNIEEKFPEIIADKTIDCLDIPDIFRYMEPKLVAIITEKTDAWLEKFHPEQSS
jgi:predicted protein tyrosine phosphatase